MTQRQYVVVEGPIGAGKSLLAHRLARYWSWHFLSEDVEANPLLAQFYHDMPHNALATQLAFLVQRAERVGAMMASDTSLVRVVADFLFEKDALFASVSLNEAEQTLYKKIAPAMMPRYPVPDLVIYLQASEEALLGQLASKVKHEECPYPEWYIKKIHTAYSEFFHQYDNAPVLIVNTDHLNLVDNDEDFELLLRCIHEMRGRRHYFNKNA